MCGIVGAVANRSITPVLLDGLKRLEYRGYDSAGIVTIDPQFSLKRLRVKGKVKELAFAFEQNPCEAYLGIAHTRWATHGVPSEQNAHPFLSHEEIALVHNGIIENHLELREKLIAHGYQFISETDSETAVHLIHFHFQKTQDLLQAIRLTVSELKGAYALGVCSTKDPQCIYGVRQGAPLVIGLGQGENFIASDPLALLSLTQKFIYLEDNDIVILNDRTIRIFDVNGEISRKIHTLDFSLDAVERGEYAHYMQKEMMEQPSAIASCLDGRLTASTLLPGIFGLQLENIFKNIEHLHLVACGTSYHAALVARYWIEQLTGIPCVVDMASEFRYRTCTTPRNSLFITLSQSGETADTLAALRLAKTQQYLKTLTICNVEGSTMIRESDSYFLTRAGVEIGVASTKAFVTQLTSLLLFAISLCINRKDCSNQFSDSKEALVNDLIKSLNHLPTLIQTILGVDTLIKEIAKHFVPHPHALFIGRGSLFPIALEGALKLKEISYIHAEGYPGGELKHGPLALVDQSMPIVSLLPQDHLFEKMLSNLQEVHARGGKLFIFCDETKLDKLSNLSNPFVVTMPSCHPLLTPIAYTIPLQLLAYEVAVLKKTDVDQPRNLAKSVTVE